MLGSDLAFSQQTRKGDFAEPDDFILFAILLMDVVAESPSAAAPRKRKRGGGGWKSNTITYPEAEPKALASVPTVQPPASKEEDPTNFQYEEQETVIEDCDTIRFCEEWCKWPRMGQPINVAHLIPMKCPLPAHFDAISDEHKFTAAMVIRYYRSKGIHIGMIVSLVHCQAKSYLTACSDVSSNWASSEDVQPLGATICTLRLCEKEGFQSKPQAGFQLIPSEAEVKTFCQLISNYLSRNKDHYVAVHCCSGFNLTGFMIASYLIEACNCSVDAAVDAFYRSRPPGIYRANWLQALLIRYDELTVRAASSLSKQLLKGAPPSWDSPISQGPLLTQELDFTELGEVRHLTDTNEIARVQNVFDKLSEGLGDDPFDAVNPMSLTATSLERLHGIEAITWKTKSPLVFLLLDTHGCFFVHRKNFFSLPAQIRFSHRKDSKKVVTNTLLLGEYVVDVSEERRLRTPRFLVLDLIAFDGKSQLNLYNLSNRLECARHEIVDPARSSTVPLRLRIKSLSKPSQAASILTNIIPSLPHEADGLLFITSTGFQRYRRDSSADTPRFWHWSESVPGINRSDLLASIKTKSVVSSSK